MIQKDPGKLSQPKTTKNIALEVLNYYTARRRRYLRWSKTGWVEHVPNLLLNGDEYLQLSARACVYVCVSAREVYSAHDKGKKRKTFYYQQCNNSKQFLIPVIQDSKIMLYTVYEVFQVVIQLKLLIRKFDILFSTKYGIHSRKEI